MQDAAAEAQAGNPAEGAAALHPSLTCREEGQVSAAGTPCEIGRTVTAWKSSSPVRLASGISAEGQHLEVPQLQPAAAPRCPLATAFAALVISLAACTRTAYEPAPDVTNGQAPIRFSMASEDAATKSILDDDEFQTAGTTVQAWDALHQSGSVTAWIDGALAVRQTSEYTTTSGGASTYWPFMDGDAQKHYYWTLSGQHRFYGVMAYDAHSGMAAPGQDEFLPTGVTSAWDTSESDWGWGTLDGGEENRTFFVPLGITGSTTGSGTSGSTGSATYTTALDSPQYDFVYSNVVTRDLDNKTASDDAAVLQTTIPLTFSHLFSAFAVTLENDSDSDLDLSSATIEVLSSARATIDYSDAWDPDASPTDPVVTYYAGSDTDPYFQIKDGEELDWTDGYDYSTSGGMQTFSSPLTEDGDVIVPADSDDSGKLGAKIDLFRSSAAVSEGAISESTYEDGEYTLVWPQAVPVLGIKFTKEMNLSKYTWNEETSDGDYSSGYYYPKRIEYSSGSGDFSLVSTADNSQAGSFTFYSRDLGLKDSNGDAVTSVKNSDGESFSDVAFCAYSGNYSLPTIYNLTYETDSDGDWDVGAYLAYTDAKLGEYTVQDPEFTANSAGTGEFNLGTADSYTQESGSRYRDSAGNYYYLGSDGNYYIYAPDHDGAYDITGGTLSECPDGDGGYDGEWRVRPYLIWKGAGEGSVRLTSLTLSYTDSGHGEYLLSGDATDGSCFLFNEEGKADWTVYFYGWHTDEYLACGLYTYEQWSGTRDIDASVDLAEVKDGNGQKHPEWEPGNKYLYNISFSGLTAHLSLTVMKWDGGHGGTATFQ